MGDYIFIGIHGTYNMLYRFFGNVNNFEVVYLISSAYFLKRVTILKEYLLIQVINIYINQKHSIWSFFKVLGTINTRSEKVLQLYRRWDPLETITEVKH